MIKRITIICVWKELRGPIGRHAFDPIPEWSSSRFKRAVIQMKSLGKIILPKQIYKAVLFLLQPGALRYVILQFPDFSVCWSFGCESLEVASLTFMEAPGWEGCLAVPGFPMPMVKQCYDFTDRYECLKLRERSQLGGELRYFGWGGLPFQWVTLKPPCWLCPTVHKQGRTGASGEAG